MTTGLYKKGIVIAIICLFIGASVIQNITLNVTAYGPPETEWSRIFGDSGCDEGYSVIETSDNSFLLVGVTTSYGNGDYDGWLIKTDSDGNEIWNKTFGGISQDQFLSIDRTSDSGFIVAGSTRSYGAGDNDVIFTPTSSVDMTGTKHLRIWYLNTSGGLINTYVNGGIQLGISDGANTGY